MKAIFIQNYDVTESIASRVASFESWSVEKRPGDGIISPVSVIKSVDGKSVLITYDRTPESTNDKAPFDTKLDDEMADNWFNDMKSKDTVEVFKELGGGLIMYVDNGKSETAIENFITKMNSVKGIDNVGLEAIKPLVKNEANWQRYIDMIPSYDELAKSITPNHNEFDHVRLESIEEDNTSYDNSNEDPDQIELGEDYTDDLESEHIPEIAPSEPISYDIPPGFGDEHTNTSSDNADNLDIKDNEDVIESSEPSIVESDTNIAEPVPSFGDNLEETNDDTVQPSEPTDNNTINTNIILSEAEIKLVKELATYLDENNTTLTELLSSISKLKLVVNQLYKDNSNVDPVAENISEVNEDNSEPVTEPEEVKDNNESSIDKFTQSVIETANELPSEPVELTKLEEPDNLPNPEETKVEENIVNDDNVSTTNDIDSSSEPTSHNIDTEAALMESALKHSKNDEEFFNFLIPYKDKLSTESINKIINIKMYDYLLTGVEFQNLIFTRQERAEKLGLF